ncbi:MAG: helix-turn-helix domain-containing protein [Kordiimonadaceae bacterium]|nr:helix-turn-helix domain-containing protein [Kordiimonadaceae bacterium]MBO6569595.1 helix-turn-helix domain-containing protein [Kordiimonadaceae bacterium]MBO6966130.1 helix-turn-helix domain-containing protein [Kordiimonadaceae bacterium]
MEAQTSPPDEIAQALEALPLFMSVKQAATFLNIHPETVRKMGKCGELTVIRPKGRQMRVPRSAIAKYLEINICHAQGRDHGLSACPEKTTGTLKTELSAVKTDAASSFRQELTIGRKLNAF